MGWMNLNDYLLIEAAATARRQDLMNAGTRCPDSQNWITAFVLAASALVIGSGGFVPSPSAGRVFHDRLVARRAEGPANRERHGAQEVGDLSCEHLRARREEHGAA